MCRDRLEKILCWKTSRELKLYKYRMLKQTKEEIFARAYEIDCMIRIYELLVEESQKMEKGQLESCIRSSNLLAYLYSEWLKLPDTQNAELEEMIRNLFHEIENNGKEIQNEKTCINFKVG